jgi:hypothetical protein
MAEEPKHYVKESRAAFAKSVFEEEAAAFEKLKDLGGIILPRFYGTYKLIFPERELDDDKEVYVLLAGQLDGLPLSKIPVFTWTSDYEPRMIVRRIIEAVSQINNRGVFIPNGPDSRICVNRYTLDVWIHDFCFWCPTEECDRREEMQSLKRWFKREGYDSFVDDNFWKPYL